MKPRFADIGRFHMHECVSTQDYLRTHIEELAHHLPICITSTSQTGGRGREGRSWHSPPGLGLYLSWGFLLQRREALPWVPLAAGEAVAASLETFCKGHEIRLKWPNDILIRGCKAAGILSESRITAAGALCMCGIGINLNHRETDFPPELRRQATSLRLICGNTLLPETVLERILRNLSRIHQQLEAGRFRRLRAKIRRRTRWMRSTPLAFRQAGVLRKGHFGGIASDGGMILITESGLKETCYSGEVSLEKQPVNRR